MNRFLIILFTFIIFIFSNELQLTYGRIINTEPVSHYLKMTESYIRKTGFEHLIKNEVVQKYILIPSESLPLSFESSVRLQATDNITLTAGDTGITDIELKDYSSIIKEVSLSTLKSKLDLVPENKVNITFYSTPEYYGQALTRAGIISSEVETIVKNTSGLALNSSIWIPTYNLKSKGEISNALTHELTHVTLTQAGIAGKLPLWLNEGTAWYTGLAAYETINTFQAKVEAVVLKESVENLTEKGKLLPLDNTDQALYNIETQGYLATDTLIKKYGLETFKEFLKQTMKKDVNRAFNLTFKAQLDDYEKSFKP